LRYLWPHTIAYSETDRPSNDPYTISQSFIDAFSIPQFNAVKFTNPYSDETAHHKPTFVSTVRNALAKPYKVTNYQQAVLEPICFTKPVAELNALHNANVQPK
jgi:hypothetical protein